LRLGRRKRLKMEKKRKYDSQEIGGRRQLASRSAYVRIEYVLPYNAGLSENEIS
jgi:hypothetical protein